MVGYGTSNRLKREHTKIMATSGPEMVIVYFTYFSSFCLLNQIEREAIILDNLQEELPEISKTKEAYTTEELSELLDCLCQYGENVEKQQLLLTLLLQRIRSIQNVLESSGAVETVPAFQEITSMQERCNK